MTILLILEACLETMEPQKRGGRAKFNQRLDEVARDDAIGKEPIDEYEWRHLEGVDMS